VPVVVAVAVVQIRVVPLVMPVPVVEQVVRRGAQEVLEVPDREEHRLLAVQVVLLVLVAPRVGLVSRRVVVTVYRLQRTVQPVLLVTGQTAMVVPVVLLRLPVLQVVVEVVVTTVVVEVDPRAQIAAPVVVEVAVAHMRTRLQL
jgi:hypothetical protein